MTVTEPKITVAEAEAIMAEAKAPHVTEKSIKGKIKDVSYLYKGLVTICLITMENGFVVVGMTAPAKSENYRIEIGERYAYDNAFRQLWQYEGYLLREKIMNEEANIVK